MLHLESFKLKLKSSHTFVTTVFRITALVPAALSQLFDVHHVCLFFNLEWKYIFRELLIALLVLLSDKWVNKSPRRLCCDVYGSGEKLCLCRKYLKKVSNSKPEFKGADLTKSWLNMQILNLGCEK